MSFEEQGGGAEERGYSLHMGQLELNHICDSRDKYCQVMKLSVKGKKTDYSD